MLTFIKQLLIPLTEPIGAVWFLMVLECVWLLMRRKYRCAGWLAAPVLLLFVFGSTPVSRSLVASEEGRWDARQSAGALAALNADPSTSAVLVLGGGHSVSEKDPLGFSVSSAGDRFLVGLELLRLRRAETLILGGSWPRKGKSESGMLPVQRWMESFQFRPESSFTNLGICVDTRDEALATRTMMQKREAKTLYLVTSALHMRRSEAVFRKAGVEVVPVPCDFQAYGVEDSGPWTPFPRLQRFDLLSLYLHEKVGWLVYRLRGWV